MKRAVFWANDLYAYPTAPVFCSRVVIEVAMNFARPFGPFFCSPSLRIPHPLWSTVAAPSAGYVLARPLGDNAVNGADNVNLVIPHCVFDKRIIEAIPMGLHGTL